MALNHDFLIANITPAKPEPFYVEEWGGEILIERARAGKALAYREQLKNTDEAGIDFILAFCVEEDGSPLFTEKDRKWLEDQPVSVINKIVFEVIRVNGFGKQESDDAEKIQRRRIPSIRILPSKGTPHDCGASA